MGAILDFVQGCETMRQVFDKAKNEKVNLTKIPFNVGKEGFRTIDARDDYAVISIPGDDFDEGVRELDEAIHPYGGSVVYHTDTSLGYY